MTHPCALVHDGLRQTFSKSRFRPVRIALTLDEGLEAYLRSLSSCIWLIGAERCVSTTVELVHRLLTTTPGVKAVILAAYPRPDDILAALKAGACGFLCQDIPGEQLIKSLELIALGEMVVHPRVSRGQTAVGQIQANGDLKDNSALEANSGELHLHADSRSSHTLRGVATEPSSESQTGDVAQDLSRREMLILRTLMEGASNKGIALRLVITESLVKVHIKAILRKLRLQNRTQAVSGPAIIPVNWRPAPDNLESDSLGPTIEPGLLRGLLLALCRH